MFQKITIRWIALFTLRTTDPSILKLKFRFINYELNVLNVLIMSFIAFEVIFTTVEKITIRWIALSTFRTTGPRTLIKLIPVNKQF